MSTAALPCGAARESSSAAYAPVPALPRLATNRYRFIDDRRPWRVVDDTGIRAGAVAAVYTDTVDLTFDLAIDFAHRFREEADLAYTRRDEKAEYQWSLWAEELEIWAAKHRPAPAIVVRRSVHHDEQDVSFAAMTRRAAR